MTLPVRFQVDGQTETDSDCHYVMQLNESLYELEQASFNWYEKLKASLMAQGFKPSDVDTCLYLGNGMMILTHVNDYTIVGSKLVKIDKFVASLHEIDENFALTNEGDINKFLGIKIIQIDKPRFKVFQPFLIERNLLLLKFNKNDFGKCINSEVTPVGSPLLNNYLSRKPRKQTWANRTAVGTLGYLQGNSRPNISMAVHRMAHFTNKPMLSHERAIKYVGHYL